MKLNPVNILFIIYDLERGGPELRLLDFARYFPPEIKIHICVTSEDLELLKDFQSFGVDIMVAPIQKVYLSIRKIRAILRYVKSNQITVINAFDLKGLIISILIKILVRFHLKIVYHHVTSLIEFSRGQLIWFLGLVKCCYASICNSRYSERDLQKFVPRCRIHTIYNGVDNAIYKRDGQTRSAIRSQLNIKKNEIILGIVANFRKQKKLSFSIGCV